MLEMLQLPAKVLQKGKEVLQTGFFIPRQNFLIKNFVSPPSKGDINRPAHLLLKQRSGGNGLGATQQGNEVSAGRVGAYV